MIKMVRTENGMLMAIFAYVVLCRGTSFLFMKLATRKETNILMPFTRKKTTTKKAFSEFLNPKVHELNLLNNRNAKPFVFYNITISRSEKVCVLL